MKKSAIIKVRVFFSITIIFFFGFSSFIFADSTVNKNNFIVAIDVGHTMKQSGAVSSRGTKEYKFNKLIADKLLKEIINKGFVNSFLVNDYGETSDLNRRTVIINNHKTNLLISIHHDSVQPFYLKSWTYNQKKLFCCDKYEGFSIFYSTKNSYPQKSILFAELLGDEMLRKGLSPSLHHSENITGENRKLVNQRKGIYEYDDLIILRKSEMPAVLFECGIIVNRNEEKKLTNPVYQDKIINAIVQAILKYVTLSN